MHVVLAWHQHQANELTQHPEDHRGELPTLPEAKRESQRETGDASSDTQARKLVASRRRDQDILQLPSASLSTVPYVKEKNKVSSKRT